MTANEGERSQGSTSARARRLRIAGALILVLGMVSASLVYSLGTRSQDAMDDPSMIGFNKRQTRQIGMLYGQMGVGVEQLLDDLKQPGTQAKIIVVISILIAAGCFYCASLKDPDDEETGEAGSPHGG